MTLTSGWLGPVLYTVWVNGVLYNQQPPILDAQLTQDYGQHDLFHLRIEYPSNVAGQLSTLSIWPDDTPIRVQWGRVPDVQTWYGYVNHKEISGAAESGTNMSQVTYVCIGTSAVLNPAVTRKWEQVSPTYIASQIAFENGFRAVTTPNSAGTLPYEVQVSESNFQFLNRIADKTGFRFWCSGGTLYMMQPNVAVQGVGSGAIPVFVQNKATIILDTCRNFRYMRGQNLPGTVQTNRVIYGIDATSGKAFSASTPPATATSRVAVKTTYATQSYNDAKNRVNAWASLAQFWLGAEAELYGTSTLYPGKLIRLAGSALADGAAGYWLVSKVSQNLLNSVTGLTTMDKFVTEVTIVRNSASGNAVKLANINPVSPEFTLMTLNSGGTWISTSKGTVTL
jgi:phage protein D